jgi:hypothetical protein
MGHINFKDHTLIKRQYVGKKMNATGEHPRTKSNEENVKNNLCLLLEVVHVFKVLEFKATWMQRVPWKNYKE